MSKPANDSIYFQRGIPYLIWANGKDSTRWATDAEVKAQYGISLAKWMERWSGTEPKLGAARKKA